MDDSEQVPAPGRIVHYVETLTDGSLTCRPAIVVAVGPRAHDDGFTLALAVISLGDVPAYSPRELPARVGHISLVTVFAYHDVSGRTAYTWHWPEKVTAEIELAALVWGGAA